MLRKTLKLSVWVLTTLIGVACIAYGLVLFINRHDRPPSTAVVRLDELYRARPTIPDGDNAFVFLKGFDARSDMEKHRSETVGRYLAECRAPYQHCAARLEQSQAIYEQWTATEPWLFERYLLLIRYPAWSETVPSDPAAPLPSYSRVMDGQRLLLLRAKVLADDGDVDGALALLGSDLRFWRMLLASADILITKMIAVAALNQNLELGSVVLASTPAASSGRVPQEWLAPFSAAELSMRRCMTGEWMFTKSFMRYTVREAPEGEDASLLERTWRIVSKPLFQPQDTLNNYADRYLRSAASFDVPLSEYAAAVAKAQAPASTASIIPTLYNPIGTTLAAIGFASFNGYAERIADVEGVRRAALAAGELRRDQVPHGEAELALQKSTWRNPYDNAPFTWSAQDGALIFIGLEKSARGEHRLYY